MKILLEKIRGSEDDVLKPIFEFALLFLQVAFLDTFFRKRDGKLIAFQIFHGDFFYLFLAVVILAALLLLSFQETGLINP